MSLLVETIKCKDGVLFNLEFHQERLDNARKELGFFNKLRLQKLVSVPDGFRSGLFRCRVLYDKEIDKIEFIPHQIRKVERLKLVVDDSVDYHLKYADRKYLNQLYKKREDCDDILIIKDGCITDSWTANPVFYDGKRWWTTDTPLLPGTQRARLIRDGKLSICRITPSDLGRFQKVGLINALQNLEDMPVVDVQNISF